METGELNAYPFVFKKGKNKKLLILFHGTGGDEFNLISLGESLDNEASLLSPRGKVIQNGMNRFFRRLEDMSIDLKDLSEKTDELKNFIQDFLNDNNLSDYELIGVGYSNGAGILFSLMQNFPELFKGGIMLRPVLPVSLINLEKSSQEKKEAFKKLRIFISSAENDHYINIKDSIKFHKELQKYNSNLDVYISPQGHQLDQNDTMQFTNFYRNNFNVENI